MENLEILMKQAAEHMEIDPGSVVEAIRWIKAHQIIAEALYDPEDCFPNESMKAEIEHAVRKEDHALLGLLLYQKVRQEQAE